MDESAEESVRVAQAAEAVERARDAARAQLADLQSAICAVVAEIDRLRAQADFKSGG